MSLPFELTKLKEVSITWHKDEALTILSETLSSLYASNRILFNLPADSDSLSFKYGEAYEPVWVGRADSSNWKFAWRDAISACW